MTVTCKQELVDFCSSHNIRPEIVKVSMDKIGNAWNQVIDKKARYRFVVDMTKDK